ncbi:hypothetical protein N7495_004089 [Penicillium taxi]|uniref:uncharacterized protein n=1 Tax=Penicillium taxi TaxID=168475 RepID=UPI0025454AFE|nr:uncharacterized protein N7495_004089 [Penicillium taxi]KAJ5899345.1 hypothetical protein N7495_004089 [Penicillium taxi]
MASHPATMKAWMYRNTSGVPGIGLEKNLNLETTDAPPAPKRNEVVVKVVSASINPADYKVPEMGLPARLWIGMPAIPGMDFCGRVVATGPDATHLSIGQLVHGSHSVPVHFGSLGEYLIISSSLIAPVPEGVDADQAASVSIAGQTAYQSLLLGDLKEGDKVFINGGSGGCGVYAIQIAKVLGYHVTTTCSARNIELCKELGADDVIDYTAEKDMSGMLRERGIVFDHILDHVGTPDDLYYQSHHFLRAGGMFVQVGAYSNMVHTSRVAWPSFLGGGKRKYKIFFFKNTQEHVAQLGKWLQNGSLKIPVIPYEFEDAPEAFVKLRSGRAQGKLVVHVSRL